MLLMQLWRCWVLASRTAIHLLPCPFHPFKIYFPALSPPLSFPFYQYIAGSAICRRFRRFRLDTRMLWPALGTARKKTLRTSG